MVSCEEIFFISFCGQSMVTHSDNDVDLDAVRLHEHVGVLDQLETDRAGVVSLNG